MPARRSWTFAAEAQRGRRRTENVEDEESALALGPPSVLLTPEIFARLEHSGVSERSAKSPLWPSVLLCASVVKGSPVALPRTTLRAADHSPVSLRRRTGEPADVCSPGSKSKA